MMAETSVFYFSPFSSLSSSISRQGEPTYKSSFFPPPPSRFLRFTALKASSDSSSSIPGDDSFNFFPWADDHSGIHWVQEERVTLFTTDGLIQIGGSMVPRRVTSSDRNQGRSKTSQRFQRFQESDYMDPNQSLCLGALFDIAATNGLDMGRRLCIFGFCRSIEMLSDVVEDTVLEHGGEFFCWRGKFHAVGTANRIQIVAAEKASKGGLHEKLTMTVAVPYLWGVPPASETLHLAVRSGGGIVEKIYWQWDFL